MAKSPRKPTGFGDAPAKPKGLAERQAPFAPALDLAAIFAAYGFRCAFTSADLTKAAQIDPLGNLLRLGPGDPDFANALPATEDAIFAYERGHLAIGTRRQFLVALDVIDPEFVDKLNPIGRLNPPEHGPGPDPRLFKSHREAFAAGLIAPR